VRRLALPVVVVGEHPEVRARLRAKARPWPENDVWIAARCRQHDSTLGTRDGDFLHERPSRRLVHVAFMAGHLGSSSRRSRDGAQGADR
jgi:hypothetical protein